MLCPQAIDYYQRTKIISIKPQQYGNKSQSLASIQVVDPF
jgi:hypothetical protein